MASLPLASAEPGMQYASCTANDGCTLAFQTSLPVGPGATLDARYATCVLLLHGFSGSSAYFTRNVGALADDHWVVAPDLRGHGNSGRSRGGYHVARLAADLRDLIAYLRTAHQSDDNNDDIQTPSEEAKLQIVPVGCSIGAAVLWTYVELFGSAEFSGFVFVDQAPLQDRSLFGDWDASRAHLGCYDEATMLAAQRAWIYDSAATHAELVRACLGYRYLPDPSTDDISDEAGRRDEEFFVGISRRCDQAWLAKLLADHTRYDHREAIEEIAVPTLVMAGRRTGCFPLEGMRETVRRVETSRPGGARMSVFEAGHWLFYEEPERFNREVVEFVDSCTT
ncbi:alpha/beta-hydrolase [Annulohypoxylon maeteangense]|uniref:alpha/beta-hydrolase n=1 Tax=Annulohypoxylon maeteangense TaxID=1927788 RepID=UPI002008C20B|nr:alpha/beta-hydrolase [Annulohypoxylon maeteangense]KAI0888321.1 alpha/beta-hydrolase [Annulohypoxylon maeteangense]